MPSLTAKPRRTKAAGGRSSSGGQSSASAVPQNPNRGPNPPPAPPAPEPTAEWSDANWKPGDPYATR
ncbi:hypothetical protein ACFYXH_01545 [Streptomyces sp. NPDC002730]|uniref:hypothetical protein n=1 Tax=Streptomyces sp. NPDC002730 TaxID=3364662 RepID=UPI0036841B68